MNYIAKDFNSLLGLEGFSDSLLNNHFTLYQGYVTNTNKLLDLLGAKEPGTAEYAELQRRFGWEWNGMRLHELYFENLRKDPTALDQNSNLYEKIVKTYGNLENWRKNFTAVGTMRGIGWAVLYYDKASGELFNAWINEHDGGHLSGAAPLLVMDVFEHAFMLDYGLKRADYIAAFMSHIDWQKVNERL